MTEEAKKKRHELAAQYGLNRFPIQNIETRKDFTQDINFSRRMTVTEAYQAGFDAAHELMEAENAELRKKLDWLLSEARILESAETLKTFEKENLFLKSRIEKLREALLRISVRVENDFNHPSHFEIINNICEAALKADEEAQNGN